MKRSIKDVIKVSKRTKRLKKRLNDSSEEISSKVEESKNQVAESSIVDFTTNSVEKDEKWDDLAATSLSSRSTIDKILNSSKFVGAHVGISGGIQTAPIYAAQSGCRAFGLFLRNQRTWKISPKDLDDESRIIKSFKRNCERLGFDMKHVLPHGSYLLNAGAPDLEILEKTRVTMLHEAKICDKLGIKLYNFHPGSSCGKIPTAECLKRIAETINIIVKQTRNVIMVLETMASQGNTVGGTFEHLKTIIDMIEDKARVGVCLDTCHIFAAGYDIRDAENYNSVMLKFDEVIGLRYLKAVHLNDSKGKLGSKLDRHANIGRGELGLECFRLIMNDERLNDIPIILETPLDIPDAQEIESLYNL